MIASRAPLLDEGSDSEPEEVFELLETSNALERYETADSEPRIRVLQPQLDVVELEE
jgi:hypothetical protein